MKKLLFFLVFLSGVFSMKSQSYIGNYHDNYAGVQSVIFNPSAIVDSRFKADINIFSLSASVSNDLYGVNAFDAYNTDYDFINDANLSATANNNLASNVDILGPSVMFNIAPKHAVAIYTRSRTFANVIDLNGVIFQDLKNDVNADNSFSLNSGNLNGVANSWGEIGLSYAAVILQNKQHFLKGGLTLKYLKGVLNSYVDVQNIKILYNEDEINSGNSTISTVGTVVYGGSKDFQEDFDVTDFSAESNSFGMDLGFTYEWRPDYEKYDLRNAKQKDNNFKSENKYKLRFGVSVTDIGSMRYKGADEETFNVNGTISQDDFNDTSNIYDLLSSYYSIISTTNTINAQLPTALHADVDWNVHNKFYLNLNADLGLVDNKTVNGNSIANSISLTPRHETRIFSFYLPMSWMEYSGYQLGTGLRYGGIFIGSGSIITNLVSNDSKAANFYIGGHIPIYQKKIKDNDNDGVLNKNDKCPEIAGAIENQGCPWPDTDGDTVIDKDDACVNVVGPVENKGCPWPDTDGDTVADKDDECIDVVGPIENKGCPWKDTDGDTVLDKDDACIDVPGPVDNNGCPVLDADKDGIPDLTDACPLVFGLVDNNGCPYLTREIMEKVRVEARSVFFETGKATLDAAQYAETSERLDAIKQILKDYPTAQWSINGYTDNTGSKKLNQKLSEERAKVVMDALIARGLNPDNLTYKGWGDANPVATNKTAQGRAENRRTEIDYVGGIPGVDVPK